MCELRLDLVRFSDGNLSAYRWDKTSSDKHFPDEVALRYSAAMKLSFCGAVREK